MLGGEILNKINDVSPNNLKDLFIRGKFLPLRHTSCHPTSSEVFSLKGESLDINIAIYIMYKGIYLFSNTQFFFLCWP